MRHGHQLKRIESRQEFEAFVAQTQPVLFLRYRGLSGEKRQDFNSVLDALRIDLTGKSVLDIGPAHGDSLDVAHEKGATKIEFIEFDPFFFAHNRLKPYARGFQIDHRAKLGTLPAQQYDLIWCKGGFSPEFFLRFGALVPLERWLESVERLGKAGAEILICPGWTNDGTTRNIPDINDNEFTRRMIARGYSLLPPIPGHNHEPDYPVTYRKQLEH